MTNLQDLLNQAATARKTIAGYALRIGALQTQLATDKKAVIDYAAVDINDREALLNLAARKQAIEVVPAQIQQLDSEKGNTVRELLATAESIKRALNDLSSTEIGRAADQIAAVLMPYVGDRDVARNVAMGMPIISSIAAAAHIAGMPPTEDNVKRDQEPSRFDADAVAYADAVEAQAGRFLDNGNSFVAAPFKLK